MKKMNKKGFTLIELLAVIIILGVLMIIAIPAVTSYIQNSRKSAYIDTGSMYIKGVVNKVNDGTKLSFYEENVLYLVPVGHEKGTTCTAVESGGQSPFNSKWAWAYVGVVYASAENKWYYYYIAEDGAGQGIEFHNQKDLGANGTDDMYSSSKATDSGYDVLKAQYAQHANKVYEDSTVFTEDPQNAADFTKLKAILVDNDSSAEYTLAFNRIAIVGAPADNNNCEFSVSDLG